jgi:hypothetical protein
MKMWPGFNVINVQSREHGDELSSIKDREFLGQLNDYQLFCTTEFLSKEMIS